MLKWLKRKFASHKDASNFAKQNTEARPSPILFDEAVKLCQLASLQMEQGKFHDAGKNLQGAIAIAPDYADAHGTMGLLLMSLGHFPAAENSLRQVLRIRPDDAIAYDNLGLISYLQGRFKDAIVSLKRAVEIAPDLLNAHNNLASSYKRDGQLQEAENSYRHALRLDSNNPMPHNNLALVFSDQGRIADAVNAYQKALELNPDFAEAHSNLLFALNYHPDLSSKEIYAAYQAYDQRFAVALKSTWRSFENERSPGSKLRIGYVSPDFSNHSVKYFLEPLMARHDKSQFEVYAYAQLNWEDEVTARYRKYADHWIPTILMSDHELAERIRADRIDILIDVAGHTGHNRLQVFARKPAPVSMSWLGFGYTTGISAIDYLLMDDISVPTGSEDLFTEQPWRLAGPLYVYRPPEDTGPVSDLPALQNGYVTFATFSRAIRLNDQLIKVWANILKQMDGAKLVINSGNFREPFMQERYLEKFAAHGIDGSRLEIACHSPPWDSLRKVDIVLDCFPHNSGTTLFESLYMGIPYITLAGRPSMGLLGSSILSGLGHSEWIAKTEEEYIEKTLAMARDLPQLSKLRMNLRQEMQASPLMDEAGFARKMETAYRSMWQDWCEKNPH
ncbi:tetratricopeptide repeat protein [Undibacterium sp. TS12]|uniref:O-linked N-acetylglucosamine transferase, SPINDLY family protein n=1 Tax=Undibacterium sp. TS12 TaxID=2908202 RepID=UPI001F4C983E|nr:tetratricopeptide repeat protein [Undibacterium sp. TS12]MCH8619626.1 tetratricopeptide repeat protein [Undibacterium sp. TS12]